MDLSDVLSKVSQDELMALLKQKVDENKSPFFDGKIFIPKRLGDRIMEQEHFKYAAEILWVYEEGVYHPKGEAAVKELAQELLGEDVRKNRIAETLSYIETASMTDMVKPDPNYINLKNGRFNWREGELYEHDPAFFETIQLPFGFDITATCPTFGNYLETTLDPEVIPLVEEIMGYCLVPDTRYEKAIMLTGSGANGKSVFLSTLQALLGEKNVSNVELQMLEESRFKAAELLGKLANIFPDLDDRAMKSSSFFKVLVTGDRITAERKFGQPFEFESYAKLLFSANKLPFSEDRTHAFYRRWLILPFTRTFEGQDADKGLREKLIGELPGILNRALTGLFRLDENQDFPIPDQVKEALEEYKRQNDSVISFCSECLEFDETGMVSKQQLYEKYTDWCDEQGLRPTGQRKFRERLLSVFPKVDEVRPGGVEPWHWIGIRTCV